MDLTDDAAALTVLIAEDELLVAMEMENHVRSFGYSVLGPASSVQATDRLLDGQKPHAALLDINLRGETVSPVARRLSESNVPFALVTGYPRLTLDDPALAYAPRLSKPVSEVELRQMLRRLLSEVS